MDHIVVVGVSDGTATIVVVVGDGSCSGDTIAALSSGHRSFTHHLQRKLNRGVQRRSDKGGERERKLGLEGYE